VVQALGPGGRLLVYGTLSGEPLRIDPRELMVGRKRVEGFWLSEWVRDQRPLRLLGLFRRIGRLLRQGVLATEVGASYPLDEVRAAVREAAAPGRRGKVLLRLAAKV
jgi:NADPH:quinone reductase-like Zn-dependent oxidoreductase